MFFRHKICTADMAEVYNSTLLRVLTLPDVRLSRMDPEEKDRV